MSLENQEFDPIFINSVSKEQAWHYCILPKENGPESMVLLCDEGTELELLSDELEILLGKSILLEQRSSEVISTLLHQHYLKENGQHQFQKTVTAIEGDGFLNDLIREARNLKSSDIHIEIYEERCRVRIRIDGMMVERYVLKKTEYPALINKIKIMSNLDIAVLLSHHVM